MHNYNWKEYIQKELGIKEAPSKLNRYFSFETDESKQEKILILVKIVPLDSNKSIDIESEIKANLKNKFDKAVFILFDPNKLTNKYGKENSFVSVYTYNKERSELVHHKKEFKINNSNYYFNIFLNRKNDEEKVINGVNKIKEIFKKHKIKNNWEKKYVFLTVCFLLINKEKFSWISEEDKYDYDKLKNKISEMGNDLQKIMKNKFNTEMLEYYPYEHITEKLTNSFIFQKTKNNSGKVDNDFILDMPEIFEILKEKVIPNIKHNTKKGEKSLNLLTDFLKNNDGEYYTPNHIIDFMCDITDLSVDSKVIDPTCGSGSFLFQARSKMIEMIDGYEYDSNMIKQVNENLIGVEKNPEFFVLVILKMLINKKGGFWKGEKSNIYRGDLFSEKIQEKIKERINLNQSSKNIILMNPPFDDKTNLICCTKEYNKEKLCEKYKEINEKEEIKKRLCDDEEHKECQNYENFKNECHKQHAKGFCFVKKIADVVGRGVLVTILPLTCARNFKNHRKLMLEKHTLKAVFSLPNDVFYPGAAVNTCIMLFELGTPHDLNQNTFFGYYKDDGFYKKKNEGRVEKQDWMITKNKWLNAFKNKQVIPGFSVLKNVNYADEWLAEAYMETDYSQLTENDFIQTIRDFIAFKVKKGNINE